MIIGSSPARVGDFRPNTGRSPLLVAPSEPVIDSSGKNRQRMAGLMVWRDHAGRRQSLGGGGGRDLILGRERMNANTFCREHVYPS